MFTLATIPVCDEQHRQSAEHLRPVPVRQNPRQPLGDSQQGDRPPRLRDILIQS